MISTNFQHIRTFLLDSSERGFENRTVAKTACVAVKAMALLSGGYSYFSVFGGANVFSAIVSCILYREIFVMANNFEDILSTFNAAAILPNWFISYLLKDTWIAGPVFKDLF